VLIMRLHAEGLLDLADPVGKYLDAGETGSVTIAQLLSHTAGLAAESRGPWSREVLIPLGMARTTLRARAPHAGGFAVHPWADVMQPEPAEHTGHMGPAGDLWSTADDLCRFAVFLLDGDDRVLPAAALEEMRTQAAPPSGAGGYGFGIQILDRHDRTLFGHTGSMPGFLATLWVSPADGLGAVALANATAGPVIAEIAADLVEIVASSEPAAAVAAAGRHRPGTPRAHRPVVLGPARDRAASAVP
jgi:CubicO group peptidase (beta-lactamase class C family)